MWLRRLLWADGGTLALALETKGRGCWPRTMAASVCLFVCVSVTRLREPRLPCIASARRAIRLSEPESTEELPPANGYVLLLAVLCGADEARLGGGC